MARFIISQDRQTQILAANAQVSGDYLQTAQTWANAGVVFSRICESTTRYTFTPCVGSFTSPGIDTRQKGPSAFSVSSERHRQMWGEEIA